MNVEHCTIRNEELFCLNCGTSQAVAYPIAVDILRAMIDAFSNLHRSCQPGWEPPECDQEKGLSDKKIWWLTHGEQGTSSKTIYSHLSGDKILAPMHYSHPYDPDDFKRCYLLLKAIPEWREEFHKMSILSPVWKNLVDNWDKLTEMYEQNVREHWKNYKRIGMYEFMKGLGC